MAAMTDNVTPVADVAAIVTPSTDGELIKYAQEGIAALKAGQPIGAYVVLDLIIADLNLRKKQQ